MRNQIITPTPKAIGRERYFIFHPRVFRCLNLKLIFFQIYHSFYTIHSSSFVFGYKFINYLFRCIHFQIIMGTGEGIKNECRKSIPDNKKNPIPIYISIQQSVFIANMT